MESVRDNDELESLTVLTKKNFNKKNVTVLCGTNTSLRPTGQKEGIVRAQRAVP